MIQTITEDNWAIHLPALWMLVATTRCHLVLINSRGRQWHYGEIRSLRVDTMNLGFIPKNNDYIEKLVSEQNVKLIVSHLYFYIAAQL